MNLSSAFVMFSEAATLSHLAVDEGVGLRLIVYGSIVKKFWERRLLEASWEKIGKPHTYAWPRVTLCRTTTKCWRIQSNEVGGDAGRWSDISTTPCLHPVRTMNVPMKSADTSWLYGM